jgi:hypothetical protein
MNIPKQEKIVLTYVFDGIDCYTVTRNNLQKYILYKIIDDGYQKLKTSNTPLDFDEIVEKDRRK